MRKLIKKILREDYSYEDLVHDFVSDNRVRVENLSPGAKVKIRESSVFHVQHPGAIGVIMGKPPESFPNTPDLWVTVGFNTRGYGTYDSYRIGPENFDLEYVY
jgi:hypothetical protein